MDMYLMNLKKNEINQIQIPRKVLNGNQFSILRKSNKNLAKINVKVVILLKKNIKNGNF